MCNELYECGHSDRYCLFTMFIELNKTILNTYPPGTQTFLQGKECVSVYIPDTHEI